MCTLAEAHAASCSNLAALSMELARLPAAIGATTEPTGQVDACALLAEELCQSVLKLAQPAGGAQPGPSTDTAGADGLPAPTGHVLLSAAEMGWLVPFVEAA